MGNARPLLVDRRIGGINTQKNLGKSLYLDHRRKEKTEGLEIRRSTSKGGEADLGERPLREASRDLVNQA